MVCVQDPLAHIKKTGVAVRIAAQLYLVNHLHKIASPHL